MILYTLLGSVILLSCLVAIYFLGDIVCTIIRRYSDLDPAPFPVVFVFGLLAALGIAFFLVASYGIGSGLRELQ